MVRILLVGDEQYIRELYSEELFAEGHNVTTVATGYNLVKKINHLQPDVVVLEIRLVDYDGLELLQEIRTEHHDLPVILSTAYDTYKYDLKSIAGDYYVNKSFDLSQLKTAIQRAIEAKGCYDRAM